MELKFFHESFLSKFFYCFLHCIGEYCLLSTSLISSSSIVQPLNLYFNLPILLGHVNMRFNQLQMFFRIAFAIFNFTYLLNIFSIYNFIYCSICFRYFLISVISVLCYFIICNSFFSSLFQKESNFYLCFNHFHSCFLLQELNNVTYILCFSKTFLMSLFLQLIYLIY